MIVNGIIGIVVGYLLGSIPSAYIAARIVLGRDIRQIGSGNVGGLNTYRQIGLKAATTVAITDISKGAAAVAIAYWLLDLTQPWVLGTALAAVIGHMWMVWLKFSGGKAVGTTVGVLSTMMPIYGYWPGLLIFFVLIIIPLLITHNVALSTFVALVFLPLIMWLQTHQGEFTIWSIVLGILIGLRYLPTARAAWAKAENKRDFFFDHIRREAR
jgi:glycerol-3-phosphate acyltransferase PlsY